MNDLEYRTKVQWNGTKKRKKSTTKLVQKWSNTLHARREKKKSCFQAVNRQKEMQMKRMMERAKRKEWKTKRRRKKKKKRKHLNLQAFPNRMVKEAQTSGKMLCPRGVEGKKEQPQIEKGNPAQEEEGKGKRERHVDTRLERKRKVISRPKRGDSQMKHQERKTKKLPRKQELE